MSLLTALTVENSHILVALFIIFLRKFPRPNWKNIQYQIWTQLELQNLTKKSNWKKSEES